MIEWRNNDIYYVPSSQVLVLLHRSNDLPTLLSLKQSSSLERSFLICLSTILSSWISHDISSWNATVYGSNICDGARRYMEHWIFRWKSWVEELIHKELYQFSSKFSKAQYRIFSNSQKYIITINKFQFHSYMINVTLLSILYFLSLVWIILIFSEVICTTSSPMNFFSPSSYQYISIDNVDHVRLHME